MIDFKYSEERAFFELIDGQDICSSSEASELAAVFWALVDKSIELENQSKLDRFPEGAEFWNEKLMYSLSGYLERLGFEDEWEAVVDQQ